jgi:hypothetical protein
MEASSKKYNGFYRGIVVQNNDPARAGRVKVFIPSVIPHVIRKNDLESSNNKIEVDFHSLFTEGEDAFEDKEALKFLKNNLPWASQLSPLIGAGSAFNFSQKDNNVTTAEGLQADENTRDKYPNPNKSPGSRLQSPPFFYSGCHDGLDINGEDMKTGKTDPDNNKLFPDLSSNQAKGMFSIPSVNSYVWVFFENGDWERPVYFGYDHKDIFWRDLYGSSVEKFRGDRYSSDYENSYKPKDEEITLLRNEIIFNTRAGTLLFDETDYQQRIHLSYRTGSNFEFDVTGHKLYVEGKSTEAINGDKFESVEGDLTTCVKLNTDLTFKKDVAVKIGSRDAKIYRDAYKIFRKRSISILDNFWKKRTNGPKDRPEVDDLAPVESNYVRGIHEELPPEPWDQDNFSLYNGGNRKGYYHLPGSPAYTPKDLADSAESLDQEDKFSPKTTNTFKNLEKAIYKRATAVEALKERTYEYDTTAGEITPKNHNPGGRDFKLGLDDALLISNTDTKHNFINKNRNWHEASSPGGTGDSPERFEESNKTAKWDSRDQQNKSQSTAGGNYEDDIAWEDVESGINSLSSELDEILPQDSYGGNLDCFVTRNSVFTVGAVVNDLPALRVDPRGGLIFAGVRTTDNGSDNIYKSIPLCEETNNEGQFPVGNTTVASSNSLKIESGAGGIKLSSTGVLETSTVATQMKSTHSIDLHSGGNLILRAAKSISITADIISIRHSDDGQVGIGGSLGVENNITVGGSAIVNGEMYVQHITAPAEIQVTEPILQLQARSKLNDQIACIPEGSILAKLSVEDCRQIVSIGHSSNRNQTGTGSGSVDVRAWAPEDSAAKIGIPPQYKYDSELDDFILEPGTGYEAVTQDNKYGNRAAPATTDGPKPVKIFSGDDWVDAAQDSISTNSPAFNGTDRLTSIEVESHSHQFKNLPLSLRTYNDDVYQEAADIEKYPDIKSIRKGQLHGKVIVKAYGESLRHNSITDYLQESKVYKDANIKEIKEGQLTGKKSPSVMDEVAQNIAI